MQKNWLGIVVVVMAAELAALCVLLVVWLPDRLKAAAPTQPATEGVSRKNLVEIQNDLGKILFRLQRLEEKSAKTPNVTKDLKQIAQNVDDLGSLIYDFERSTQKNLMLIQKNIMRRLSAINPSGASAIPKDPVKLQAWLKEGGVTLEKDRGRLKIEGRIVNPSRPLELIAAAQGGQLHETLLETFCRPSALRAGLLALGLKEGDPADYRKGTPPTGEKLHIELSWPGLEKPIPLENFLWNGRSKSTMKNAAWLFTGSDWESSFLTGEDVYIPDEARVLIALTDNFGHLSVITAHHADSHNENIWSINQEVLPEDLEQTITVTISRSTE